MVCEIVSVGTELLLGDIVNTNVAFLSQQLAELGVTTYVQTVVGDNLDRLKQCLAVAFQRADLVITSGGLGPTDDDLTKEAVASFWKRELVWHPDVAEEIQRYFEKIGKTPGENNAKQALLPKDSQCLHNKNGTAPGIILKEDGKQCILLPGPPNELIPMFLEQVKPYLQTMQTGVLVSKTIRVAELGESEMALKLKELIQSQSNPTVAPYAKPIESILRLTAKGKDTAAAMQCISPVLKQIYQILGDHIYGEDETNMQEVVAKQLIAQNKTIAVSESCTGGLLSARLIEYPGISQVFLEGAVTYQNEAKMRRLGVKKATLEEFGAVSSQTAAEMASGIALAAGADIGLSTTGVAGPEGGTAEKPVGLVYIGLAFNGKTLTKELRLQGDRQSIREQTVFRILNWLRLELAHLR